MDLLKATPESSTGWRTEALLSLGIVIGLALLGDLAGKYELGDTAKVLDGCVLIASQVLAIATARARQAAKG